MDLGQTVRELVTQFKGEAEEKGYKLGVEVTSEVVGTWDPGRIEQVVRNLISNALKYGEGKPIQIFVGLDPTKTQALFIVKDRGMGISSDLQEKIFKRFERAIRARNISGLGLGLYITRQIVEAHGGRITVRSRLGQGAIFTVEIPLHPSMGHQSSSESSLAL